jgi:hypothetical protein
LKSTQESVDKLQNDEQDASSTPPILRGIHNRSLAPTWWLLVTCSEC